MTKRNKQVRVIINIILAVWVLGLLALVLAGCNPVKQVLKDPAKFQKVFNEGVSRGMCVNDTLIVSKSDTLVTFDTLYVKKYGYEISGSELPYGEITYPVYRDSVKGYDNFYLPYKGEEVIKTITKTIRIRDTLTKVVTDNSRIDLLQKQLQAKGKEIAALNSKIKQLESALKDMQGNRNEWRFRFFLLALAVAVYLFRKPLLKLISPIKF